ncbi:hypothetical protein [Algiphilus sp.]|uniref:hypothetical protein n=1 Tax=Algiphilus sp. TaxID=1872431 RepID=UPI003CCBD914
MALPTESKTFADLNAVSSENDSDLLPLQQGDPPAGGASPTPTRKWSLTHLIAWIKSKLGTAAVVDTGPALDEVPTGQDLRDGVAYSGDASAILARPDSQITGSDRYIALADLSKSVVFSAQLARLAAGSVVLSLVDFAVAVNGGSYNLFFNAQNRASTLEPVTFDADGKSWIGFKVSTNTAGSAGIGLPVIKNVSISDTSALSDLRGFDASVVSNEAPAVNENGPEWSGRPGDSIGDNGPVANVNQSLGQRTNFAHGTDTQSGNGAATTFNVAHGLGNTPTSVNVTPRSTAASEKFWVSSLTSTNIVLTYASAPASATDNLVWDFQAYREA